VVSLLFSVEFLDMFTDDFVAILQMTDDFYAHFAVDR
jgi:hypothetical protein